MLDKIEVHPFDEANDRLSFSSDSIAFDLKEFFSYMAPNYRFDRRYKRGHWDGKVSLFNTETLLLPTGLRQYLYSFCKMRNIELDFSSVQLKPKFRFDLKEFIDEMDSWKISIDGVPQTPYDYQIKAVSIMCRSGRRLLESPTSSGKTLIMYMFIRWLLNRIGPDEKIIVIVPTLQLISQFIDDFRDYSTLDDRFDADETIHAVFSEQERHTKKQIVVGTWHSIDKIDREYFTNFKCAIVDEAHGAAAKTIKKIMMAMTEASWRFGLTGTVQDETVIRLMIESLTGPIYTTETTKGLQNRGIVSPLKIYSILLKHDPKKLPNFGPKLVPQKRYHNEMTYLIESEERNRFITNLTLDCQGNTLVLFQFVERHGKILYETLEGNTKGRKVFLIHGGVEKDDRDKIKAIVKKEKDAIIIASYQTFSAGISIKNLMNLVLASPSKSKVRILQSIGRILRKSPDKNFATLYDIGDNTPYGLSHSIRRSEIYDNQDFTFKLVEVNLHDK